MPPELDDDAFGLFLVVDVEDVFQRQGFEVELVTGIVIRGNSLWIRVHHDGLEAKLAQGERGVDAAVIELDALANAVRAAAQNHHLALATVAPLILAAVGRVIVRCVSFELRRARIYQPISRNHVLCDTLLADRVLVGPAGNRYLAVGEAQFLGAPQRQFLQASRFFYNLGNILQEPRIDLRQFEDLLDRHAALQSLRDVENTLGVWRRKF